MSDYYQDGLRLPMRDDSDVRFWTDRPGVRIMLDNGEDRILLWMKTNQSGISAWKMDGEKEVGIDLDDSKLFEFLSSQFDAIK